MHSQVKKASWMQTKFIINEDYSCDDKLKIMAHHSTEIYVYDIPQQLGGSPSVPQGQGSLQPEDTAREKKLY